MNRLFIILLLVILSCTERYNLIIDKNQKLIEKELINLEICYASNSAKTFYRYDLAKDIFKDYLKLKEIIITNSTLSDTTFNKLIDKLRFMRLDSQTIDNLIAVKDLSDKNAKIIQLQYVVLYSLKELKESISSTDFSSNVCRIEVYKEGINVRLIISKLDTTEYPNIMIGELNQNLKFRDSFLRPDFKNGYGFIPLSKLKSRDSIEGLYLVPLNNGSIDTIKFKSKIK